MNAEKSALEKLEDHILSEPNRILLDLWKVWRGPEVAPRRSDVRIEDLGAALSYAVELELESDTRNIFRFAGSDIVKLAGQDHTGTNFFDTLPPDQRAIRISRSLKLQEHPCGMLARVQTTLKSGAPMVREVLGLPVLPDRPDGNFCLLNVSYPLDDYEWQTPVREGAKLPLAADFHFVDVGAGVPAGLDEFMAETSLSI